MRIDSSRGFDPYRSWLNVQENHRPLNAYQLLGLPSYEEDSQTIAQAARRQRVALRAHRAGGEPALWDEIHEELEEAIHTLTDPDSKDRYDEALRERQSRRKKPAGRSQAAGGRPAKTVCCPGCEEAVDASRKYCSHCGATLWEPCYRCGATAAADERFCGTCGANLVDGLREQETRFEEDLDKARRLHQRRSYEEAIALLTPIAGATHSRLTEYARAAEELTRHCVRDGEVAAKASADAMEAAEQLVAEHQYEEAVQRLSGISPALRTDAMNELFREARAHVRDVAALRSELHGAESGTLNRDLIEKTGRLLSLNPSDPLGLAFADRIRRRLVRVARDRLSQGKYQEVCSFLDQLPATLRDGEIDSLRDNAEELQWLWSQLRNAPIADATLLALGKRYVGLAPTDTESAALLAELERRLAVPRNALTQPTLPWAVPQKGAHDSCTAAWLTAFRRIGQREGANLSALVEHPGCFYVACGLALQGLGGAAVNTNLMPDERGLLERLAQLMTRRLGSAKSAWGFDLSSSGLKAMKLATVVGGTSTVIMEEAAWLEHRKPLHQAGSPVEERTLIAETIARFLESHKVSGDRLCLGVPSSAVILRDFRMPAFASRKQEAAIEHQVTLLFPVPPSELLWDYAVTESSAPAQDRPKELEVKLVAVRKHPLIDRTAVLEEYGLHADLWQCDCIALHNFLQYDGEVGELAARGDAAGSRGVTVAVDIGCDTMSVVFSAPQTLWFRTSAIGAHRINRVLVQRFGLTFAQSEQWKRQPQLAASARRLYADVFLPVYEDYLQEVQEAMHAFRAQNPQRTLDRVVGVGGGWRAHGFLQYVLEQTAE